jgi:hypothetical protein
VEEKYGEVDGEYTGIRNKAQGTRHKKVPRVKKEKEESQGQRGKRVAIEMQQGTRDKAQERSKSEERERRK